MAARRYSFAFPLHLALRRAWRRHQLDPASLPSPSDVPQRMDVIVDESEHALTLEFGYSSGEREPRERLMLGTVEARVGRHSERLFSIRVVSAGLFELAARGALDRFVASLLEQIGVALNLLIERAMQPGPRKNYVTARLGLEAEELNVPPAWMIASYRSMRGERPSAV